MSFYQRRSIPVCIILSIVTCGIYGIYWWYCIIRDFYNSNTPSRVDMSPIMVIVLSIITCHIYSIYMYYKWGKQSAEIMAMYGRPGEDKSLLYLLLSIFGLDIVNYCIIQNDFNSLADYGPAAPPPGGYYQQPPQQGGYYQQQPPPPPAGSYPQSPPPPAGSYPQQPPPQADVSPQQPPPPPPPGSPYSGQQ